MSADDRMLALIKSASPHVLRRLCVVLWAALMYAKPTSSDSDEWAKWFERFTEVKR